MILSHGNNINNFNIDGIEKYCLSIKDINNIDLIKKKINLLHKNSNVAVIGCGPTGSELIGKLIDENLLNNKRYNIFAIDTLKSPLSIYDKNIQNYVLDQWNKYNINLLFNKYVSLIDDSKIYFNNKEFIKYDIAFWCGGTKPNELTNIILNKLEIKNKSGIPVDKNLMVKNYKIKDNNVFAIGDCSDSGNIPSAQLSYQHGRYLANLFNNNFKYDYHFNFFYKGQICYVGNKNSVYDFNNKIYFTPLKI